MLCAAAARVRDAGLEAAGRPGTVTYSRKVFVPLTRLCRDRCHYSPAGLRHDVDSLGDLRAARRLRLSPHTAAALRRLPVRERQAG